MNHNTYYNLKYSYLNLVNFLSLVILLFLSWIYGTNENRISDREVCIQ